MSAIPLPDRRSDRGRIGDNLLEKIRELEEERDAICAEFAEKLRVNAQEIATFSAASHALGVRLVKS